MLSKRRRLLGQSSNMTCSHIRKSRKSHSGRASTLRGPRLKSKLRTLRHFSMLSKMFSLDFLLIKAFLGKMSIKLTRPASNSMMLWLSSSIMMESLAPNLNMWPWTISGGYTKDSSNPLDPTRNGWQIGWAERLVFPSRTAPLTYSGVWGVKMTPFSTAQLMIAKTRVNSLWQSTTLGRLMILMTSQESSYQGTTTKLKFGPLPRTISLMWHRMLSSKSTGGRTAPHGPTTSCFSRSKIHLLLLPMSKFWKPAKKKPG